MGILLPFSSRQKPAAENTEKDAVPDQADEAVTWSEARESKEFCGKWVALNECTFDSTGETEDGQVVDADDDVAALCCRLREADQSHCAVVFCKELREAAASGSSRPPSNQPPSGGASSGRPGSVRKSG